MNNKNDDAASGKVCRQCGDRIGAEEGHEIDWAEIAENDGCHGPLGRVTVYVHTNCA